MLTPNLKSHIDRLWDKFWSGGIADPLTAIQQITYLLFIKRIDELDKKNSIFKGNYQPFGTKKVSEKRSAKELRWSSFKTMEAEKLLKHVQHNVFPFLKKVNGINSSYAKSMSDAVFVMPKASMLKDAIKIIDEIYEIIEVGLKGKQMFQDTQGDVYEYLLSELATAGKMGQFRTPRHIIKLVCELIEPKLGQKIADPACGTGGFLLGAYQYILTQYTSKNRIIIDEDGFKRGILGDKLTLSTQINNLESKTFFGFDMDPSMVRIGAMNLMMHGISKPNIENKDTLSKAYNQEAFYDVILANPPFKGTLDKSNTNKNLNLPTTKTELLFIERIYRMLKVGGQAGVIIPQGVLFSSGTAFKETRKILLDRCELSAVISLPGGVFQPYAGVSTAILIFRKKFLPKEKISKSATKNVWFYDLEHDGYTMDGKRTKIDNSDIGDLIAKFQNKNLKSDTDRTKKFFYVSLEEIIKNNYDLSFNRYKEDVYEKVNYIKPQVLLDKIKNLSYSINKNIAEIEELI